MSLKDQRPEAAVDAAESLNRSEEPDIKSRSRARTTRKPILDTPRSWRESIPTGELEEDQSPED